MYRYRCLPIMAALLALLSTSCTPQQISRVSRAVNALSTEKSHRAKPQWGPLPANALDRYEHISDVEVWWTELYEYQNFDKLEAFIRQSLEKEHEDEITSGMLMRLYRKLGRLSTEDYAHTSADEQAFEQQKAILDRWIAQHPKSHIPLLIRGILSINYGWEHRGSGRGFQVNRAAWSAFKQYLQQARADLKQSAALHPEDPNSWDHLIQIARGLSLPQNQMDHYYQQGLMANLHHLGIRVSRLEALYPWWGGSWQDAIAFAKTSWEDAVADDKPMLGITLLVAARELNQRQYGPDHGPQGVITWSNVQEVYHQIFSKYPDYLRMRYYYANDAIATQHYSEALEQFELIGDRWTTGIPWHHEVEFHRDRASTYYYVAQLTYDRGFEEFKRGNQEASNALAEQSEQWALKATELWPQARTYLLLASISGNVEHDFAQVVTYAQQALATKPSREERQYAEGMIQKAKQLQGQ